MGLVTTKEMFKNAYDKGYAIGAFNVNNMEIIQGIIDAAVETKSPVILQVSAGARKYARTSYVKKLVEAALEDIKSKNSDIDICLHLDHGDTFELCKDCIDSGFTSVMIDGSKYSFDENVALTKKVVEYAHEHGVVVEAELGTLAGIEDDVNIDNKDAKYTNPKEALKFVELTGCDSLAIAIGTSHGAYKFKSKPHLRFDILDEVARLLPGFPIVLHGASSVPKEFVYMCNKYGGTLGDAQGVPESLLREAASKAVCKINIDSDIRLAMTANIRECFFESPEVFDPRTYLGAARQAVTDMVKHKIITVLGSNDRC